MKRLSLSLTLIALMIACWLVTPASASGGNAAPAGLPVPIGLPDPKGSEALGWTVLVIGGLLGLVGTGAGVTLTVMTTIEKIRGRREIEIKQPLRTTKDERYVSEKDLERIETQMERIEGKLDEMYKALDNKRSVSVAHLHGDLKETEKKLAAVEASCAENTRQVANLDQKLMVVLRNLPEKK